MVSEDEIPFIKASIEQAWLCISENGSPRPKVGAVLVKDGKQIGATHRGGDGNPGAHAEFLLLEHELKNHIDVTGATLYTTLEPCVERGPEKIPCADRIIARRIARVVIGMIDPDQRICGRGIRKLRGAGIQVDLFPSALMAQVEDQNREFIRHREQLYAEASSTPVVGLTLEKVEFEPAPDWHFKFKLRMYWTNDGDKVHIGKPSWIPGGIGIQGSELGHKFQLPKTDGWGDETNETVVLPNQRFRVYIGLDPEPDNVKLAGELLAKGRVGTLVLPLTVSGKSVEWRVRPMAQVLR